MVNLNISTNYPTKTSELTYSVLIENEQDGRFSAVLIGLPDCKSSGATEDEAIEKLQQILQERLQKSKIVTLSIETTTVENPWMKFAGMFEDDPQFDEMLENIETYRRELDAEMEEYYRQLDAEDQNK